jgi:trafficking protein particle complex subunit 2
VSVSRTLLVRGGQPIEVHAFKPISVVIFNRRSAGASNKSTECYLGLLYALEDVAVYGYITPLKVKIVLALGLTDSVVRDADITMVRSFPPLLSYFKVSR